MWCPNQECPDALESGSPAEFVEGMIACPFCGAALVSYPPEWANAAEPEIRLAPVMPIADAAWLPRVKEILDAAGIPFQLQEDGARRGSAWAGTATGFGPGARGPLVMVEEADAERASGLLADLKAHVGLIPSDAPLEMTPPAWQPAACPQCGKALETGEGDEPLAYCYHCGASLSPETTDR